MVQFECPKVRNPLMSLTFGVNCMRTFRFYLLRSFTRARARRSLSLARACSCSWFCKTGLRGVRLRPLLCLQLSCVMCQQVMRNVIGKTLKPIPRINRRKVNLEQWKRRSQSLPGTTIPCRRGRRQQDQQQVDAMRSAVSGLINLSLDWLHTW